MAPECLSSTPGEVEGTACRQLARRTQHRLQHSPQLQPWLACLNKHVFPRRYGWVPNANRKDQYFVEVVKVKLSVLGGGGGEEICARDLVAHF